MFRRHFFLVGALSVLVVMLLVAGLRLTAAPEKGPGGPMGKGPGGGAQPVSVALVEPRTFVETIEVIGVAKGRQSVTLTAAATQLVERVHFRDGQSVPRGAVLVELKATEQDAAVAQARARMVEAERAYERWKTLADQGYAAKAAVDQREAAFRTAQADLRAAQSRQGDRTIRAPFAGVVGLSDVAPGALVNPGAEIVTLDDVSTVRVDFEVPERHLASIREGQAIEARLDAYPGEVIRGQIARLDTRVDERTRAITARAEFPNPDRRIRPGMMVRIAIASGERESLAAPEPAVSVQGESAFVYVITQDGQRLVAEQRPILTGMRQDGFVEIRDGVRAGERLVGDGLNQVQGGQPVRVVSKASPAGTAALGPQAKQPAT